jgi:alpha/beta superfamily hydrolase
VHYVCTISSRSLSVLVHPLQGARAIIINIPGYRGDVDGYNNKYVTLADYLVDKGFAVVRMPNVDRAPGLAYTRGLLHDVYAVIKWVKEYSQTLTGTDANQIHLMGFSAGGYAAAMVAGEYPSVTKVLLMEPSISPTLLMPLSALALAKFTGEAYVVIGDHNGVGPEAGAAYCDRFVHAKCTQLVTIKNCDHQFTGERNGKILANAPLWAFAGKVPFPSTEGAPALYD